MGRGVPAVLRGGWGRSWAPLCPGSAPLTPPARSRGRGTRSPAGRRERAPAPPASRGAFFAGPPLRVAPPEAPFMALLPRLALSGLGRVSFPPEGDVGGPGSLRGGVRCRALAARPPPLSRRPGRAPPVADPCPSARRAPGTGGPRRRGRRPGPGPGVSCPSPATSPWKPQRRADP